jgi:hypothetical protein
MNIEKLGKSRAPEPQSFEQRSCQQLDGEMPLGILEITVLSLGLLDSHPAGNMLSTQQTLLRFG